MHNLYIPLCGLILNIVLLGLYIYKVAKVREENKIYLFLVIDTLIMTVFCMIAIYLIYIDYNEVIIKIANKIECCAISNYFLNLIMYVLYMCGLKNKKTDIFYFVTTILMFSAICLAPINLKITNDLTYMVSVGPSVDITTICSGIILIITFIIAIKNHYHKSIIITPFNSKYTVLN